MIDSRLETTKHILRVKDLLREFREILQQRGIDHDESKLKNPEKDAFDIMTEKLKSSTYGSEAYKQMLKDLQPTLDHHYANNSHHPEHYPNGIDDMDLFDIVEQLDWHEFFLVRMHSFGMVPKTHFREIKQFQQDQLRQHQGHFYQYHRQFV